jgi:hypothetical protein
MWVMRSGIAVIALLALAACGGGGSDGGQAKPAESASARVTVELQLPFITTPNTTTATDECEGALDYLGVRAGAAVTIRDKADDVVGQGKLKLVEQDRSARCTWEARIAKMDTSSKFFSAEVAGWKSGPAEASGNHVDFSLSAVRSGEDLEADPNWKRTS